MKRINKSGYYRENKATGEVKRWATFNQMQSWYRRLSMRDMTNWSGWWYQD